MSPHDAWPPSVLTKYLGMSIFQNGYEVYAYVTQWPTSPLKCTQMTLAISVLKITLPSRTNK